VVGGRLGLSDQEIKDFLVHGEVKQGTSRTTTTDIWRAVFGPFGMLVERVPWERVLKGKGVQEGWTFFKEEVFQAQEQAVPMCHKMSLAEQGALARTQEKKEGLPVLEERAGDSRGVQGSR